MPRASPPVIAGHASGFELRPAQQLVWARIRRLFPEHALATGTWSRGLAITWTLEDDPTGSRHATPILVRFEPGWEQALQHADATRRAAMVEQADAQVRQGMLGYQPTTAIPQARVIVVG